MSVVELDWAYPKIGMAAILTDVTVFFTAGLRRGLGGNSLSTGTGGWIALGVPGVCLGTVTLPGRPHTQHAVNARRNDGSRIGLCSVCLAVCARNRRRSCKLGLVFQDVTRPTF